ncbi:putative protein kinase [Trypanosoma rangeli]|uniref:Protein kinase domain-containing protein n=1 Tax=Trypanosoma rangeli TaxID=5698 RepID=A0A422NA08_TRYRA|nr:putative protein kinase [Trypanosoma rangeli]RNF02319.1 putative protein kinase [Trypanosoma rangeli]|eukprot:RNF02319.1 putative protein kinase [Trypanosoma rangeli]
MMTSPLSHALFSGATAVPGSGLFTITGFFMAAFLFLPWSTHKRQLIFMIAAFLLVMGFAILYWWLSRQSSPTVQLQNEDAVNQAIFQDDGGLSLQNHRGINAQDRQHEQGEEHSRRMQLLSHGSAGYCSSASPCYMRWHRALPAIELCILGILVIVSPHVMVINEDSVDNIVVSSERISAAQRRYPVSNVWKVSFLHAWFLFAFNIPLAAGLAIGLVHFAVLMTHFRHLGFGSMATSLLWLLIPLCCIPVVAVQHRRRRLRQRLTAGMLNTGGDALSSAPHASSHVVYNEYSPMEALPSPQYAVRQEGTSSVSHRQGLRVSPSMRPEHFFSTTSALLPSLHWRNHSAADDILVKEPLDSLVTRHDGSSIASTCGIQPPYLLLSPSGGVILGASESFAAHVGMTVERLVGQTFMSVLGWLEVENREALEEVVQKVTAFSHNSIVAARDDGDGADCRLGPGCVDRRSLQTGLRVEAETVVESQGGEYSTVQGGQSLPRMGDGTVRRILLRGRCPCRSSSTVVSPLVGDQEVSARIHADGKDDEFFTVEHSFGGGEYFCLSLDVWMCPRQDSTGGFLVLCQPRLHCVLDWTPLACFLVHPVTGCVLYWSREAERQTERLAYEMLGWQSQAIPTPHSTGFGSRHHDIKYDNMGGKKETRRRGTRLEPSLQAILQLPFPPALSLSVTLQPLAGKFVEEEEVALEGAVAGLLWPPLHSLTQRNTHTASDSRRAASYPPDARGSCWHRPCVGDVDGNKTPFPHLHLPEKPLNNFGSPVQEKTGWCFASLASAREDASTWLSAKVPLLFTIHSEVSMPFGSSTLEPCVEPGHDSMHASAGSLPEHQTVLENLTHQVVCEMLPASSTGENGVEKNVCGMPPQGDGSNQDTNRQPSNGVSLRRGSLTTHALQHTESEGLQRNICNEDEKDPDAKVTRDEAPLKLPQLSTRAAIGSTLTPASLQASLRTSQHVSPILSNARKATCVEPNLSGACGGGSDANSDNCDYSSKQRGKRDSDSRGCTALTPLDGRSSSKLRDVQVPRLISPLPREHPTSTRGNIEEACSETVLFGKQLGYNPQQYPQQPSYPQQPKPSLLSPQPLAIFPALSSAAGSTALSDFATTPISNVNTTNEGYPIWAMLRSGDEATIPSCVIRVPPGEGFLFGRSSQCHATTVDGFVSGIQFKIVRQLGSELQLLQPTSPRDSSHPNLLTNPTHTSTFSGPHPTSAAPGNWIFVLYDQSVNGTFVNVRKVGNGKCVNLRDHDLITFRLSSSRFFLGFQFLLTNEQGTPLSERADVPAKSSGMNSSAVLKGARPLRHRTSSETGSFFAACNSQLGGGAQSKSNGGSSSRRPASATRSRSSRAGAAVQHRETIEWKIGEELLGKGGNAEVFLGMNMTNGKLIAVKRVPLPTTASEDPNHKEGLKQYISLQEEIKVLSKAIHPNIVQYFGSSQNLQYFNILLEFVPGGSLRHLLDNFGALSPGVICSYLRQTLEGLHYLHQHNLVHSDVKAANILVTEKGRVKLSDFGTAKLLNRQHSQSVDRDGKAEIVDGSDTATFRLAGTLRWMAPELLRGGAGPTKASDIWSVGCTLIEMLSTEAPWSEYDFESEEQLMNLLKYTTEPPEVPECVELPELTSIARRCLTFDADSRPTCAELLQLVLEAAKRYQEQQAQLSSPADVSRVPPATTTSAALPSGEGAVVGASVRLNSKHEGRPQHRDPQEATDVTVSKGRE